MDEFTFLKKFLILESYLKSKFLEFEGKPFSELLSYSKEKNLFPLEILFDLSIIWQVRNSAFGKLLKFPKPKIPDETLLRFKRIGKYFKINYE
jgi:hypothetical protein